MLVRWRPAWRTCWTRLDDGRVGCSSSRPHLGVSDLPSEQRSVRERTTHKERRENCDECRTRRNRLPPPAHERNQCQNAERDSKVVRLVTHLLVRMNHLPAHPWESTSSILAGAAPPRCGGVSAA